MNTSITTIKYIGDRGELHDCTITNICFDVVNNSIKFSIEDINFGSEYLPDYNGPEPKNIILCGLKEVSFDFMEIFPLDLRINEFNIEMKNENLLVVVSLWGGAGNGGIVKILCDAISIEDMY